MCGKADVGGIDVFSDLRTLGALIPVSTAYKRKKDKIRPLDRPTDGEGTGGDPLFLEKCEKQEELEGRHTQKGPPPSVLLLPPAPVPPILEPPAPNRRDRQRLQQSLWQLQRRREVRQIRRGAVGVAARNAAGNAGEF